MTATEHAMTNTELGLGAARDGCVIEAEHGGQILVSQAGEWWMPGSSAVAHPDPSARWRALRIPKRVSQDPEPNTFISIRDVNDIQDHRCADCGTWVFAAWITERPDHELDRASWPGRDAWAEPDTAAEHTQQRCNEIKAQ